MKLTENKVFEFSMLTCVSFSFFLKKKRTYRSTCCSKLLFGSCKIANSFQCNTRFFYKKNFYKEMNLKKPKALRKC